MTGMDFVKAFEWARKHPSAYGKYARNGNTEPSQQMEVTSVEQPTEETNNQTQEERN